MMPPLKLLLAFCAGFILLPQGILAQSTVYVGICQVLDQPNTLYILQNDVSSASTCFTISKSNITLDLNGHTVTYGTGEINVSCRIQSGALMTGDVCVYGIAIPAYYLRRDYFPDPAIPDSAFVGAKDNITIRNGNIIQAGNQTSGHAIFAFNARGLEVSGIEARYQGNDTQAIAVQAMEYSHDVRIHDNRLYPNGSKTVLNHYGGFQVILLGGRGGNNEIYNNYIEGVGMSGISASGCRDFNTDSTLRIYNNTIKMYSEMVDGYAIVVGGISIPGMCEDGFEIFDNFINQSNGRGIYVSGNVDDNDYGPGNGSIYNNYVEVKEGPDPEYVGSPGRGTGLRIRFGAHDIKVYNNTFVAHAGVGMCPTKFGSDCYCRGIYPSAGYPYGSGNEISNNTIIVSTNSATMPAGGIFVSGYLNGNDTFPIVFTNNRIISNNRGVIFAHGDGWGNNMLFKSNTFVIGENPVDYHVMQVGYWIADSLNETFVDTRTENSADADDLYIQSGGTPGGNYSIYMKWYLIATVKDNSGTPVQGAAISVTNSSGEEVFSGTTGSDGTIGNIELTEYYRYGSTYLAGTSNYIYPGPYTVTASKSGKANSTTIAMDASKSVNLVLDLISQCIHKSDNNPCDGCVDQPELTAFIDRWKVSNVDVTLKEIMEAIGLWKRGC